MYTRVVQAQIRRDKINDLRTTLDSTVLPVVRQQPGLVDIIEACDPDTGKFYCMTLWRTREDADRYGNGPVFQKHAELLTPFAEGQPSIETLPVETSTVHSIAKGKAA